MLRDGQTTQLVTAADKVSGEVVKIDVTLNVVEVEFRRPRRRHVGALEPQFRDGVVR